MSGAKESVRRSAERYIRFLEEGDAAREDRER